MGMFNSAMMWGCTLPEIVVWFLIFSLKSYICIEIIGISVSDVDCRFALGRFLAG